MKKFVYQSQPTSIILLFLMLCFLLRCTQKSPVDLEKCKQEIMDTEKAFAQLARDEGITKAFSAFAAQDAVLLRGNRLIRSRDSIEMYYSENPVKGELSWQPDFIDVSSSGDLGYTYGSFTFTMVDSTGQSTSRNGVFHTVWKKQPDGSWKYVWD